MWGRWAKVSTYPSCFHCKKHIQMIYHCHGTTVRTIIIHAVFFCPLMTCLIHPQKIENESLWRLLHYYCVLHGRHSDPVGSPQQPSVSSLDSGMSGLRLDDCTQYTAVVFKFGTACRNKYTLPTKNHVFCCICVSRHPAARPNARISFAQVRWWVCVWVKTEV